MTAAATRTRGHFVPALCLAVAAPVIGELVSSSTPPLQFFVWWIFALFVLLYGSCCLLIRELVVRWGTGWRGILVLGAAFAILDEGILTRAFFDPVWPSLGPLTAHGRWFGVNIIWTFDALLYHSILSIAIPVQLIHLSFPQAARQPWLKRWHLWTVAALLAATILIFLKAGNKYPAPALYLAGCVAVICFLFVLARFAGAGPLRESPPLSRDTRKFFLLGFTAMTAIFVQMYALPALRWPPLTLAALISIVVVTRHLVKQWTANGAAWTASQQFALSAGVLACMAVVGGLQEINPTRVPRPLGMSLIGISCILFLLSMRKRVLAFEAVAAAPLRRTMAMAASAASDSASPGASYSIAGPVAQEERASDASAACVDVPLLVRAVEIVVAATILVLTSPVLLLLAFLIRRGTPGPAFFFQPRLGKDCAHFRFVKFRTLYADARLRFPGLYAYKYSPEELATLKFKIVHDPRVTPQGEWMRKSTLDELPNFWNVLTGEMALVGPRPEIPEMLPYYTGEMRKKFSVRPGVTGLAQISGRGRLGFYETVDLDLEYVRTRSLTMDTKVLALTAFKMVTRDGAF